jgi:hypothetical protein
MLFIAQLNDDGHPYFNTTECDLAGHPEDCNRAFYEFLNKIDRVARKGKIVARSYVELAPIGTSLPWPASTGVKDVVGIDPLKYSVERDPRDPTKAIVYSISEPRLALCYYRRLPSGRAVYYPVLKGGDQGICTHDRVYASANRFSEQWRNGLVVRSTYQIIEYLGQILHLQENTAANNRCIKLADEPSNLRKCDAGDVLFQVNPTNDQAPLVSTTYQGSRYTVGISHCNPDTYCDHSAEVMKIVNLLININKSAANIPQVPIVRVVQ